MIDTTSLWIVIIGLGLGSFFLRFVFTGLVGDRQRGPFNLLSPPALGGKAPDSSAATRSKHRSLCVYPSTRNPGRRHYPHGFVRAF